MKNLTFRLLRTYAEARSGAATCNTNFPRVWPTTAYQSGVIELSDLKERRERVSEECKRLEEKLIALKQQQQELLVTCLRTLLLVDSSPRVQSANLNCVQKCVKPCLYCGEPVDDERSCARE